MGLGAMATAGHMVLASVGAGCVLLLLASRDALHKALIHLSEADLRAIVRLALVALVVLPLLPDATLGPFGLNPRRLWLVVVTIGAISLAGYALSRWLGGRGVLIAASLGALFSSTAVTLEASRAIRAGASPPVSEAAIAFASIVMIARALLLVFLVAPAVLPHLAEMLLPAVGIAAAAAGALLYRSGLGEGGGTDGVSPPGLGFALLFALLVALLTTLAAWAEHRFGPESAALVIAIGGMADVDSAIAAVGTMRPGRLAPEMAALAIAGPILFNTLLKLAIVVGIAGPRRAPAATAALAVAAAAILLPASLRLF
jgi:uncharacterized membrane protein (DUF4010 family)